MDDLKRLEFKIDKIDQRINNIDVTIAAQHESLKDHIRRTNLLEEQIRPIEKHVHMVSGVMKFLGMLGVISAIVETIILLAKR